MEAFKFCMEIESNELNSTASDQFSDCFFKPNNNNNNWDNSDPFESALSSIVSSPATATNSGSGDGFMIRELIGRLGNIRSSGEISPPPQSYNNNNSTDNSCYGTPLNSPPKLNLSMAKLQLSGSYLPAMAAAVGPPPPPSLAPFSGDPGFAERAAKNSLFGSGQFGYKSVAGAADPGNVSRGMRAGVGNSGPEKRGTRVSTTVPPENGELGDSREGSSVSDQIPLGELGGRPENENDGNAKKRKSSQRGKPKELPSSPSVKDVVKVAAEKNDESNAKKIRKDGASASSTSSGGNDKAKAESGDGNQKQTKESSKPPEPPKDYIHVRARRGQATDSHSLAERVRREKISERMKFLQDLVPGCNKVTGKAVMLDEIINYVQSLQRQVEFLSMKLATVNPRMEFNVEALLSKDIFQSRGSVPHGLYPLDSSSLPSFPFGYQNQHHHHHHHHHQPQQLPQLHNTIANDQTQFPETPLNAQTVHRTPGIQLPTIDGFAESASQASTFFEDDLQSLVQMGFGQIQQHSFQGSMASTQMKVEL